MPVDSHIWDAKTTSKSYSLKDRWDNPQSRSYFFFVVAIIGVLIFALTFGRPRNVTSTGPLPIPADCIHVVQSGENASLIARLYQPTGDDTVLKNKIYGRGRPITIQGRQEKVLDVGQSVNVCAPGFPPGSIYGSK